MKKDSAAWSIAAIHFLAAGFAIPWLSSVIVCFGLLYAGMDVTSIPAQLLSGPISLVSVWLGVMYSANYLAKKYVITDVNKVVNLSTIYKLVLVAPFILWAGVVVLSGGNVNVLIGIPALIFFGFSVVSIIVFYIASKKYIKQDRPAVENY